MQIDRRQFLVLSGMALLESQKLLASDSAAPASSATVPWHQKIKRIGQINFNERDPVELDVNAWADYWADLKVDAVLVSVTGIIAFYPTAVPFHRKTPFLNDRDFFGDCVAAAKKRGLRVIARMSPDLQWQEATVAHPEWFRKSRDGSFVPRDEAPELFNTCLFSTYFTEHIPAIMREVNSRYDIDGIFTNAWPPLGNLPICYCDICRGTAEAGTPEFIDRHSQRTYEIWKLYSSIAREKRPDNIYFGNLGYGTQAVVNIKTLAEQCDWFNCDNQGRGGDPVPAWGAAQQGRVARCVMKGKPITNVTGSWATGNIKWRNVAKGWAEANLWMAQTAASGMVVWYHWLGGQSGMGEDHRWQENGRQFFHWLAKYESHFTYKNSITNLGVVWAQRPNGGLYKPPGNGPVTLTSSNIANPVTTSSIADYMQGLYYALLEGRFAFDFVHEDDLGAENLKKYSALLLPNVALLSDEQIQQLKAYADGGGSLLTTFETGRYDQNGKRRDGLGLGELFGIQGHGEVQGPKGNSFFARIEKPHEILNNFGDTHLLPGAEYRLPVKTVSDESPVLTVVPAYTAYPPELSFSPDPPSNEPAVVIAEKGNSRLIHFPGDIDRTSWRSGNTDVSQLMQNAIRWVTRNSSPVSVIGDGVVEIFAWETDPGYAIHILNYTNPNFHKGAVRKHYPIGPQMVKLQIPDGVKIASVELLRAEKPVEFKQTGNSVEFTIPTILDYEVAALTRV